MSLQDELPICNAFSLDELQQLALTLTLQKHGVPDVPAFLRANDVVCRTFIKADTCLAIAIGSITQKPSKASE